MTGGSCPIEESPGRRSVGRATLCGIILPALLVVSGCGADPAGGATPPGGGSALSNLAKKRVDRANRPPGTPPKGKTRSR
jgi:hypothetical protein